LSLESIHIAATRLYQQGLKLLAVFHSLLNLSSKFVRDIEGTLPSSRACMQSVGRVSLSTSTHQTVWAYTAVLA
jgi:hypothetical protein